MKKYLLRSVIIAVTAYIIAGSCARQAAPAGGPKDIAPPVILKSEPPSGTTGFTGNKIVISFNEFVTLDKLNEKLMVSPPMEKKPEISIKGKSMVIELKDKLRDSTTYTLYFQDAIRDLNEGNPINNYQYVFATGNVIDSLSLTGNAVLADNLEAEKNVLVMLHSVLADTAPVKILPDYITLADENGGFRINNIKGGNYRLFALSDNNNNKRYDLADELFAFHDTIISITPETNWMPEKPDTVIKEPELKPGKATPQQLKQAAARDSARKVKPEINGRYKLFLSKVPQKKFYLTSSDRKLPYQFVYTLSLPPDTMKFEFALTGNEQTKYYIERSARRDTMVVWLLDSIFYSNQEIRTILTYPYTDSSSAVVYRQDTILLRFIAPRAGRGKPAKPVFRYSSNISSFGIKPGAVINLTAETPFGTPDTSRIRLYETDGKVRKRISFSLNHDAVNSRKLIMDAKLKEGGKYLFIADRASFRNIYGDMSDSSAISFSVREEKTFGQLDMNITGVAGNTIIQLLNENEKLLTQRMITRDTKINFPLLEKGNYRIRAIYDLDRNGLWTTGDYAVKRQPEPVSYYPGQIEMRVDFWVENSWDVSLRNQKDKSLRLKEKQ